MIDLGIGFNEMQWLVLVIFSAIISFMIGKYIGISDAIDYFNDQDNL
tara:strand:+ start:153 stop:293 length:141 start_codon:yes stop_codon:yes gene_type:complete